ncbi:MAG: SPFH domain-containing protein [Anaerolineae bacterium]|nr:SPFH domain-containing protein [Anaerolineae bacterium]
MARVFDLIEVPDQGPNEMVRRVPESGSGDFRIGSQVIVRESQMAVFFRDGKALDVFGPGRHTITTANVPLLVDLVGKAFGNKTPFKAEVYFVNTREFPEMGWGTDNPIPVLHPGIGLGASLLRAFGTYGMQITDPQLFVSQFVGTQGIFRTSDIQKRLRAIILSKFRDMVGELQKSAFEIQGLVEEIGAGVKAKAQDDFAALGITLKSFYVQSITPSESSAEELRRMGLLDLQTYTRLQAADAMRDAAQAGGTSMAGMGVGLGAGAAMGKMMADTVQQASGQEAAAGGAAAAATIACPQCGNQVPAGSKFCNNCGAKLEAAGKLFCSQCGAELPPGSKFCSNCGAKVGG